MSGTWAEALAGRGLLPGLPWGSARAAASAGPRRWRAPVPAAVAKHLRTDARVESSSVPRALVAAVAELLRRYGGDEPVALLVQGEAPRVLPLLLEPAASLSLAAAVKQVVVAESRAAVLPPVSLEALHVALPHCRPDECFAVRVAAGPRAAPLGDARLQLSLVTSGARAALVLAADGRWLSSEALATFGERLIVLLAAATAAPRAALGRIDLLRSPEAKQLTGAWAGRRVRYPERDSISALLRAVASKRADAVAVEDAAHRLTYGELLAQAVRLRDALVALGIRRGARVGVLIDRSAEQSVALAGVLEAAAVAVPLDAAQPRRRLQRMAELVSLDAIVTVDRLRAEAAAIAGTGKKAPRVISLTPLSVAADAPGAPLDSAMTGGARAAYVLFTSGSTGEPKGVECPHRAVVRLVVGNRLTRIGASDRVLGHAPFTFDVNLFETWGALLNGATLVHAPTGLVSLAELGALLTGRSLTVSCMTPGIFREMAQSQLDSFSGLRLLLVAGEAMPSREAARTARQFPALLLVNGYGPTENNYTTEYRVKRSDAEDAPVPIGRPIDNTTVYLIDPARRLVPPGMIGELCTGGDGLAIGYVGRTDLTAERFVMLTLPGGRRERVYRTGDLARHRADGVLEFLGRADAQVKVRGNRVELEEVERVIAAAPGVNGVAVVLIGEGASVRLRAAIVVGARRSASDAVAEARRVAEDSLPSYMVPAEFVVIDRIPLTAHEKVDRRAIAAMPAVPSSAGVSNDTGVAARTVARAPTAGSTGDMESALTAIWRELLAVSDVDREAGFFDVGGTSLLALKLAEAIRLRLNIELPIVRVFEFPSIARMAAHLAARGPGAVNASSSRAAASRAQPRTERGADHHVAIIGVAGRFPGAPSPDALWTLLHEEREGIRHFSRDEIDSSITDRAAPHYSPARGVLDDVESFDPEFFGMNPRLAEITDPQQRLLLEAAWNAFEDAAVVPGDGERLTGVFTGVSHNSYADRNLATHPELADTLGDAALLFANDKDYSALHIAHRLDLRGPALAVQTSSSTSLTAIAMAVQAIRAGQCDMALAGGAAVTLPMNSGHAHVEGGMFSRDGRTRTFDADASGTVFSDGVAMVLLQRLSDAERDGRRILGVIHGVGVTNDGAGRASFSAPTVQGQEECVARAFADAGWSADAVSYVEAHGTGTPLGDPIEIEALTRAFARTTDRKRFCWIGSVKSNLGHLTAAAGAASVIKVVQAMRHGWIPRTLHVDRPNPRIDFVHSPFLVARAGLPWESEGGPRRAGVSSFGVGGTNVHVLIEEYENGGNDAARAATRSVAQEGGAAPRLLFVSARTPSSLRARARELAGALDTAPDQDAADANDSLDSIAWTLRSGRRAFECRAALLASTRHEAISALRALAASTDEAPRTTPRDIILLFPGQGTQTAGAGKALYDSQPAFREAIDRCVAAAGSIQGKSLKHWLFATDAESVERLRETDIAQSVLFAVEYALGAQLLGTGLRPTAMVGHSIGEFAAAALAGVMSIEDTMRVVVERGRLMASMKPGAMLAVRLPVELLRGRLAADTVIAAINAPLLCVVAGPDEAISRLEVALLSDDVACRRLQTSHAFHSPSMDEAAQRFETVMQKVTLRPPSIPFASCVSGALITDAQATDPAYWARQLREPVRFADALSCVSPTRPALLVEAGPRETLSALGRQILAGRAVSVALLPARTDGDEHRDLLAAVGSLWRHGADALTWGAWDGLLPTRTVSLPGYPYERRRLWVDAAAHVASASRSNGADGDLRALLQAQLGVIQDQLSVLRTVGAE